MDLMNRVCRPYLDKFVVVFVVDVLIYSRTKKDHEQQLKMILELPQELSGIHDVLHVFNLKKCLSDETFVIPLDEVKLDTKLPFIEEPHRDYGSGSQATQTKSDTHCQSSMELASRSRIHMGT
jgi:hypothetical protein